MNILEGRTQNILKKHANKIKEKGFSSVAIIGAINEEAKISSYRVGDPYDLLISTLSTFYDTWEEIEVEIMIQIKDGKIEDSKFWRNLRQIAKKIKSMEITTS